MGADGEISESAAPRNQIITLQIAFQSAVADSRSLRGGVFLYGAAAATVQYGSASGLLAVP